MHGLKNDTNKPNVSLVDPQWILEIAKVLDFGANKYSPHNWRQGLEWSRLYSAIQRHLLAFLNGEILDPESNLPHLHHAACGLMMLSCLQGRTDLNDFHWGKSSESSKKEFILKHSYNEGWDGND